MTPPRPKLGQHFLRDLRFAYMAVDAARIHPGEIVLEVGPGHGVLTRLLLERGAIVHAIELDPFLAAKLRAESLPGLVIHEGDAVRVEWPAFDKCVSNLPYQISSPFLFRLLDSFDAGGTPTRGSPRPPPQAVLLVQKEFADRLVAKPRTSDYGRLSVSAARRADITFLARVPPGAFDPPPRVDSALVEIVPHPPRFEAPPNYDAVVERAFAQRRKKLRNSLGRADIPHADARPEELTPEELAVVARALR